MAVIGSLHEQSVTRVAVNHVVGCGESKEEKAAKAKATAEAKNKTAAEAKEQSAIVEKAIRFQLQKPTGELTKADLKKVRTLSLGDTEINRNASLVRRQSHKGGRE